MCLFCGSGGALAHLTGRVDMGDPSQGAAEERAAYLKKLTKREYNVHPSLPVPLAPEDEAELPLSGFSKSEGDDDQQELGVKADTKGRMDYDALLGDEGRAEAETGKIQERDGRGGGRQNGGTTPGITEEIPNGATVV